VRLCSDDGHLEERLERVRLLGGDGGGELDGDGGLEVAKLGGEVVQRHSLALDDECVPRLGDEWLARLGLLGADGELVPVQVNQCALEAEQRLIIMPLHRGGAGVRKNAPLIRFEKERKREPAGTRSRKGTRSRVQRGRAAGCSRVQRERAAGFSRGLEGTRSRVRRAPRTHLLERDAQLDE
jgi:hypothetical protein